MDPLTGNVTDAVVIAIVVVSGALAFSRGLVREVLVVAAWIGAAMATLYLFPILKVFLRDLIALTLIADGITGVAIFVVTLFILSLISHRIASRVRRTQVSTLDRSLGFVFGLARGGLIVCIAYLALTWFVPASDQPEWVRGARVAPLVRFASARLLELVPDDAASRGGAVAESLTRNARLTSSAAESLRILAAPPASDSAPEAGYGSLQRRALDQLIRAQQQGG